MIEVISNTPLPTYFGGMESWQLDSHTVRAIAMLSVRLMAGLLFIFQAYDRIFKIGLQAVANTFVLLVETDNFLRDGPIPLYYTMHGWN